LPTEQSQALAALAKRAMQLQISVQDGSVWFNAADANVEVALQPLLSS
jgi:uncharacterized protein YaeQ